MQHRQILSKLGRSFKPEKWESAVSPLAFPHIETNGYKTLRDWQDQAHRQLRDLRLVFIVAMPGSGKTTLQLAIAAYRIIRSGFTHKVVIAAPTKSIAQGFVRGGKEAGVRITLDKEDIDILVDFDLSSEISRAKREDLKGFLNQPVDAPHTYQSNYERQKLLMGCICVTTHQALAQVTSEATRTELRRMTRNTTFVIDEAHHVKGVFDGLEDSPKAARTLGEDTGVNRLGLLVHSIIYDGHPDTNLILASATPFRADAIPVLYPAVRALFKDGIFVLPFIEHFRHISIDTIDLAYQMFKLSPVDDILRNVKACPDGYHLIAVPHLGGSWRRLEGELERLERGLADMYGSAFMSVVQDDSERPAKMIRLLNEPKRDPSRTSLRAVVYVRMINEGVDWPACSHLHNASFGESLPSELQKLGRMLRDFPGKTRVSSTAYLADFTKEDGGGVEDVNNLNVALLIAMQYDDMCHPIFLPESIVRTLRSAAPDSDLDGTPTENKPLRTPTRPTVDVLFGWRMHEVWGKYAKEIEVLRYKDSSSITPIINRILDEFLAVPEHHVFARRALELKIIRSLAANMPKLAHINMEYLVDLGFDRIVYKEDLVLGSMYSCSLEEKDLLELRSLLNRRLASEEALKAEAHKVKFQPGSGSRKRRREVAGKVRRHLKRDPSNEEKGRSALRALYPPSIEGQR